MNFIILPLRRLRQKDCHKLKLVWDTKRKRSFLKKPTNSIPIGATMISYQEISLGVI